MDQLNAARTSDTIGSGDSMAMDDCTNTNENSISVVAPKGCFGARHMFALMTFLGTVIAYMLRVNLSVAIVAMVNRTQPITPESSFMSLIQSDDNSSSVCPGSIDPINQEEGEFNWDSQTQGLVLGVFSWGYMASQIPSGIMAERFGGKYIFGFGVLLTGLFNLLTPLAARSSLPALYTVRVLTGIAEGVTFPVAQAMMARWVPKSERSKIGAFVYSGTQFGTVLAYPLSGYLCSIPWDNGWPLAFYVPGVLAAVWFVFWLFLVYNGPEVHPRISEEEKLFILSTTERENTNAISLSSIPWLSIFTSIRFWAIFVAHFGHNWGFYVLLSELPTYMKTVLNFDLHSNSLLSAVPYLAMWLMSAIFSNMADALRNRKVLSLTQTRKIFNFIGFMGPACALIGASYTGCNRTATFALITVCTGLNGAIYSGFMVNHLDLASNYSGILMAMTNTAANLNGFLAPYVIGLIVTTEGSVSQWQIVFFITAGIYTLNNLFYLVFGTGVEQPWNQKQIKKLVE